MGWPVWLFQERTLPAPSAVSKVPSGAKARELTSTFPRGKGRLTCADGPTSRSRAAVATVRLLSRNVVPLGWRTIRLTVPLLK